MDFKDSFVQRTESVFDNRNRGIFQCRIYIIPSIRLFLTEAFTNSSADSRPLHD